MSADTEPEDEDADEEGADVWSDAERAAAAAVERRCGISLVPDDVDD